jgi:error-prone DNA polymerase
MALPAYAELRCLSNYSFLRGASWPEELVERAHEMGYSALAITDECSVAGVVRAHTKAKECGLKLLIGSQFKIEGPLEFTLTVIACNLNGYGNLCQFITKLRRLSDKGTYKLALKNIAGEELKDCVVLMSPNRLLDPSQLQTLGVWLLQQFMGRCWLSVEQLRSLDDEVWLYHMTELSLATAIPLVATGDVHMHVRSRKPLQDVQTAVRVGRPLSECGYDLQPNAEQHLRSRLRIAQAYPLPLLEETLRVADRCDFSLEELRYKYPKEVVPVGETPDSYLRRAAYEGAGRRWPQGVEGRIQSMIEHELELIQDLKYAHYFLTVYDLVAFARSRGILCQGRGSAANSVVCYCLGVTEVDPARMSMLFERFISRERAEPPDIDVDFEHERREEVIQYLYRRYGRTRAALTAVVISYRPRSAIRDVGKALGFDVAVIEAMAKDHQWWDGPVVDTERMAELGLNVEELEMRQLLEITQQLMGFPRHLSQHPGGFVLTEGELTRIVPVENASMADRTVIQWDKDDIDALGILKVDVLALGMLTAIRKGLEFVGARRGFDFQFQDIPAEDSKTYDMVCKADTVGVFQIESRAQMSMLPRLKPRCFYDLVIEVALVRPGPIQGGMVHPYLNRRQGLEPVVYPSAALEEALGRTLGVPVFQEQVMQVAILAAGFTPGEADGLRRAMAAWKRKGGLQKYYDRIVDGMTSRGYERAFADGIFEQIKGFSEYGFPESHAASFALLVYASCWLKCNEPAAFLAAMLNSQPLGFYSPSQLVADAKRHGVEVRPIDVMTSEVDATLEDIAHKPAVRLGFRLITGMRAEAQARILAAREESAFLDADDLSRRAGLSQVEMKALAAADALRSLSGHRRQQVWDAAALTAAPALLRDAPIEEDYLELPEAPEGEEILWDYSSTGLTLRRHPLALLRPKLDKHRFLDSEKLRLHGDGSWVRACGIVTLRQQPSTANGVIFVSLEDEFGAIQLIVWKSVRERQRDVLLRSRFLGVQGWWQKKGEVANLIVDKLVNLTPWLGRLPTESRNFR